VTAQILRPLIPLALVFSLIDLCLAAAYASDSSDSRQPHSYGTNPPPNRPRYGLESPDTLGSSPSTDLYGNLVEQNTPQLAFSSPPSKSSAPEDSRAWVTTRRRGAVSANGANRISPAPRILVKNCERVTPVEPRQISPCLPVRLPCARPSI